MTDQNWSGSKFPQSSVNMFLGSILGGILILFFVVVYSHPIFFSNRWDAYAPRYQEVWFFAMSISVLIPLILQRIKRIFLTIYLNLGLMVFIGIWIAWVIGFWPGYVADYAYTSIGYAFVDHLNHFQTELYLGSSLLAAQILECRFPFHSDDEKIISASSHSFIKMTLMGVGWGLGFCILLNSQGLWGLYACFIISAVVLVILCGISIKNMQFMIQNERNSPSKPIDRGSFLRFFFLLGFIFLIMGGAYFGMREQNWAGVITVLGFAFPIIEILILLITGMYQIIVKSQSLPHHYGDTIRGVAALLMAEFAFFITMLLTDYYRYMGTYFIPFLISVLIGMVAFELIFKKQLSAKNLTFSLMLLGTLLLVPFIIGIIEWNTFLQLLLDPITGPTLNAQDVSFFGPSMAILSGLPLGGLIIVGIYSLIRFDHNTDKTPQGFLRWEGNALIWPLMLIPFTYYMGRIFFETRIFEWNGEYLIKNFNEALTVLLILGAIILLVIMVGGINGIIKLLLKKIHESPTQIPAISAWTKKDAIILVFIAGMLLGSYGSCLIYAELPRTEPAYRTLVFESADLRVWSTYAAEKVTPDYQPGVFQTEANELSLTMVCGETERLHLILTPDTTYHDVRIEISALIDLATNETFPATRGVNWYYATYNFGGQEEHLVPGNPTQYRGRENVTQTYLDQIMHWSATAGKNQPLWLSFTSNYNTTAGDYIGTVQINAMELAVPIEIPITIRVVDYQKPLKYRLGSFLGSSGELGRALWRHQRMGYHPSYEYMEPKPFVESINWSTSVYVLNWSGFDQALNNCAREGYTHLIYNWYPGDQTGQNGNLTEFIPRYSAKWNATVLAILADAQDHLSSTYFDLPDEQGQIRAIDMVYMELYDEPGKDDAWRLTYYGQILDQAAPDWRLVCTTGISRDSLTWPNYTGPGGVFDVVDVRVEGSAGYRGYRQDPIVRAAYDEYPAEIWFYDINSPWPPYPNSAQGYNPGTNILSHVLHMYVLWNVSGYLFWTAGDTAWADGGDGYAGWGSGRYFYKVDDGSGNWDPGYRFEVMDEGMEIAELLRHVDAVIEGTAGNYSVETRQKAHEIRNLFNQLYPDYPDWPRPAEIESLYSARAQLIDFLVTEI